ncbi:MAG: SUMF1/EgtB/PvdO family nonheme iron enzyme [Candidatus Riflebacteria bacterium]|nr:SUMF1/EgtB/PvdO family nonheme iron enzyme [Candidatus Riflebacteria bacterium]
MIEQADLVTRTILTADIPGFSSQMKAHPDEVLAVLTDRFYKMVQHHVRLHDGKLFRKEGDAVWCTFGSVVSAVKAAIGIQEEILLQSRRSVAGWQFGLRVGIHLGDVQITREGDVLGNALSVAKRLETDCVEGAINVSAKVYEELAGRSLSFAFEDTGERELKGIGLIRVYRGFIKPERYSELFPSAAEPARTLAGPRLLLVADMEGWLTSQEAKTSWEREALRHALRLGGHLIRGEDGVLMLVLNPDAPVRELIRSSVLAGPRRVFHYGEVLTRRGEGGEVEDLFGEAVEDVLLALRTTGRESDVTLMTDAAGLDLSSGLGLGLEPAGLLPSPREMIVYRVLPPDRRPGRLSLTNNPRTALSVTRAEGIRPVDLVAGVNRGFSAYGVDGSFADLWWALADVSPVWGRSSLILGIQTAQILAVDAGVGLGVALALLASLSGHQLPIHTVGLGQVDREGKVHPPEGARERLELVADLDAAVLIVAKGLKQIAPPGVPVVEVATVSEAHQWVEDMGSRARLAALEDAVRGRALTVVVGPTAGREDAARQQATDLARELEVSAGALTLPQIAEEAEELLGRDELVGRYRAWLDGLPENPLARPVHALPWSLLLLLAPEPGFMGGKTEPGPSMSCDSPFAGQPAVAADVADASDRPIVLGLAGHTGNPGTLVLTEADYERLFAGLAGLDAQVRQRLAKQTTLILAGSLTDPTLRTFFRDLKTAIPSDPSQLTFLVGKLAEGDARWWERRGVRVLEDDPDRLLEQLKGALVREPPRAVGARPPTGGLKRSLTGGATPYKFLDFFGPADRAIFFGREREVVEVTTRLLSYPLMVLFSRSGAGKTSLIKAGILSRFPRPRHLTLCLRSFGEPLKEIKAELENLTPDGKGGPHPERSLAELFSQVSACISGHLVVVLDQFEEFFVHHTPEQRSPFIHEVADLLRKPPPRTHLLISLREDFLAELSGFEDQIPSILDNRYRLTLLPEAQARKAICGPAELFGIRYDETVVTTLLSELLEEGIDPPQLQIVCDRLYASRDAVTGRITLETYERLGGVRQILVSYLQTTLDERLGSKKDLARKVLSKLVSPRGTKEVTSLAGLAEQVDDDPAQVREVVLLLVHARLLRELTQDSDHLFELAHDYLIQEVNSWVSDSELALKHARMVLRSELDNWQRFGSLMGADRLAILERESSRLNPSTDEHQLLLRAATVHERALALWLASPDARSAGIDVLVKLLEDPTVSPRCQRRVLECLFTLPVESGAVEAMVEATIVVGNPTLLANLEQTIHKAPRPELLKDLRWCVDKRFFGPLHMTRVAADVAVIGSTDENRAARKSRLRPDLHGRIDSEGPLRRVDIDEFWIDRHLVTNDEFAEFRPAHLHRYPPEEGNHPAVYVTWYDATEYATWLGKELPSEEEWEKAARGPEGLLYPWGNEFDPTKLNSAESGLRRTTPVDAYPQGASPYGCFDMAGNVWEWTQSDWSTDTPYKTQKGGSTVTFEPHQQCSARYEGFPDFVLSWVGFRTVCHKNPRSSRA